MQVQIDPLVLVLDLEQLLLRSPEELLPLLENHILLIIMGQLRDIKERERLSRGLCREYNKLFEKNDILVFPRPLSTKQTDARLLAPRKLAHLVGAMASAVISEGPTEAPASEAGSKPAPASSSWDLLARLLGFALLLITSLLPVVGMNQIQSQSQTRLKVAFGPRAASLLVLVRSAKPLCSLSGFALLWQPLVKEADISVPGLCVAATRALADPSERTGAGSAVEGRSRAFEERLGIRELRAQAPGQASPRETFAGPPRRGASPSQAKFDPVAANRDRDRGRFV